ncbi:MAG: ATP-binding cassette domain-containing protein [Salinivirgaceae bacterium]|nr:ATP-binding cassette domain-containing protein [Salinivirgaceae bacterium]
MSESILKALMQLFALIANVNKDGITDKSRSIVESYLDMQLSQDQVKEYLELFDHYIEVHHGGAKKDAAKARKRTSLHSVKVLGICEKINEELHQDHKILVVLQLLEFISYGEEITEKDLDFVKTVSDIFNIPEDEYFNSHAFSLESSYEKIPYKENVLIIDKHDSAPLPGFKHLQYAQLEGKILVLFLPSINMYALRYVGENDLYLNGHSILLNRTHMLPKGSAIRNPKIGSIYYSDIVSKFIDSMYETKVAFCAKDVEFRFKNSPNGIHKFNFSEQGGELIGIMGGSGVGKSTLLNVLNGNLVPQSGKITINGLDLQAEKDKLEGVIGFVPQDDLLIEELTVYQNLYYNAKLCFNDYDEEEIKTAVNKVLEDLDLKETSDLIVGNPLKKTISGGQRKRLNIALELIRQPLVMFVDEPTSGLSSMDSEMVMDLLKEQTLKGKLVIINIHQPSSDIFKMFDKLLIMDKGGYLVYYGNPVDAVVYFKTMSNHVNAMEAECYNCGNINPEQVLQILEAKIVDEYGRVTRKRKTKPSEWSKMYEKNLSAQQIEVKEFSELPKNNFRIPNVLKQFRIFSIRNVLSKLSNKQFMLINFLEAPLLAFILAFFTKYIQGTAENPKAYIFSANENVPIYLFMAVVVSIFIGLTVSAEEIIKDRQLLKRESFLNLSRFSYLNSKILILFIISAIQTICFILVGNLVMEIHGLTFAHWLILFSVSCVSNMLGLNISSALDSVITIYILIPFLVVPQLLFSGTMVKFEKLHRSISSYEHVPILGDMMFSRWAYEAMAVKQFRDNDYQKNFFYLDKKKSEASYIASYLIPALFNKISKIQYGEDEVLRVKYIEILQQEIEKLNKVTPKYQFGRVKKIVPDNIDEVFIKEIQEHLQLVTKYYQKKQKRAINLLDERVAELTEELGSKDALIDLKKKNHNDFLADLVLNRAEINKIHDTGEGFVQLADPVYKDPSGNYGRAHFYASIKRIGSFEIDTYWFNFFVIWLYSIGLYVLLLTDGLRKIIEALSRIRRK